MQRITLTLHILRLPLRNAVRDTVIFSRPENLFFETDDWFQIRSRWRHWIDRTHLLHLPRLSEVPAHSISHHLPGLLLNCWDCFRDLRPLLFTHYEDCIVFCKAQVIDSRGKANSCVKIRLEEWGARSLFCLVWCRLPVYPEDTGNCDKSNCLRKLLEPGLQLAPPLLGMAYNLVEVVLLYISELILFLIFFSLLF